MTPHKDPAKLSIEDQIKILREDIEELKWGNNTLIRSDLKELNGRFDSQDKKFDKLYKMISGFVGRIKRQDEEIASIAFRKEEHEERISRLETTHSTITP